MRHRTPLRAIAKWATGRFTALDGWIFAADDRAAATRGWQIDRSRLFTRTYRDPRWDLVEPGPVNGSAGGAPLSVHQGQSR
jgi:hypothetical protein